MEAKAAKRPCRHVAARVWEPGFRDTARFDVFSASIIREFPKFAKIVCATKNGPSEERVKKKTRPSLAVKKFDPRKNSYVFRALRGAGSGNGGGSANGR